MAPRTHNNEDDYEYSSDYSAHSTMTADDQASSLKAKPSRVTFATIEVREYERVVGDHPDTKVGPPLAIGWAFVESEVSSVDDFEAERESTRKGLRRMSSITRKNVLKNVFLIPEEEIRLAEKEVQKILASREKTSKQGKVSEKLEEKLESFGRKLKRGVFRENLWKGFLESQRMFPSMIVN